VWASLKSVCNRGGQLETDRGNRVGDVALRPDWGRLGVDNQREGEIFRLRLERGRFVWPLTQDGAAVLTPAQLSMLCEGIDWRMPIRTDAPRDVPMRAG
jgi:hypothetical protein